MKDFKLDNEPKISSGFISPDGYFDTFSEKLSAQLPQNEPKVISLFSVKKAWFYGAAAVVLLLLSVPAYNNYRVNQQEMESTALENYIAYHSNISQDDIVDLLSPEDLDKMKMELNIDDQDIEDALKASSNLEEYIID